MNESDFVAYMVKTSSEGDLRHLLTLITKQPLLGFLSKLSFRSSGNKSHDEIMDELATQIYYIVHKPHFLADKNVNSIAASRVAEIVFGLIGTILVAVGLEPAITNSTDKTKAILNGFSIDNQKSGHQMGLITIGFGDAMLFLSSLFQRVCELSKNWTSRLAN